MNVNRTLTIVPPPEKEPADRRLRAIARVAARIRLDFGGLDSVYDPLTRIIDLANGAVICELCEDRGSVWAISFDGTDAQVPCPWCAA